MLIYHPAFDTYHCLARILNILDNIPLQEYSKDRIKIYDYFLLFPNELRKITLPTVWNRYKTIKEENRYNQVQNSRDVFMRVSSFQELAFGALASFDLIDTKLFNQDIILRTAKPINFDLVVTDVDGLYFQFLNDYANKLSLKEFKERTKLMAHKYELS
ncbi:ABC-three component system middle component 5 [Pedobacter fastidiosus]|uniref:Uncharacterized protein n=1 Tax=Pedobacter fastidiosus TaxID=2765361 RepID=A0ABR7KXI1_9SPHI|nr:ABC-three component system middle component 5 [Pedobacter fastidiosus]MBC6112776.1 hypothetical protein [Pedobacter fastidiosus]